MAKEVIALNNVPLQGGIDHVHEKGLLETGSFSSIINFRPRRPGFEQRKGMAKHHTTKNDSQEAIVLFGFSKGGRTERHLFKQLADGSIEEGTDNPPTVTTGNFGTQRLGTKSGVSPATFSVMSDIMMMSDGQRQHQLYPGSNAKIKGFVVYKGTSTIPDMPTEGYDYTDNVKDDYASTSATLSSLDTLANFDAVFVGTSLRANTINFEFSTVNVNASTLTIAYRKNDGTWANVSGQADGTALSGATFGQNGAVTWTLPTDEVSHYMFGKSCFWYRFTVSAALDSTVVCDNITYAGPFQDLVNVWDGALVECAEAQVFDDRDDGYSIYPGDSIDISEMQSNGSYVDYLYLAFPDPLFALYADAGEDNNISASTAITASCSFVNNSTGKSYVEVTNWIGTLENYFSAGMSVAITGTTSNNVTVTVSQVSGTKIYVGINDFTDEVDSSTTITYNPSTAISEVGVWTGASFESLTFTDGTAALSKPGFITLQRNVTPTKSTFNGSINAYWYRIKFSKDIPNEVFLSMQGCPYFDVNMEIYYKGQSNAAWKNRAVYSFNDQYIYITPSGAINVLNGEGYSPFATGDGRGNKVLCMRSFYNELLVWSAEKGAEGGCLTLVEGNAPDNYDAIVLSSEYGIMNSKCAVVLENINTSDINTKRPIQKAAFWLSRSGVCKTDGVTCTVVSPDIQNYFDATRAECIRAGYEDKHFLGYDPTYNILMLGLVSGSSATMPNKWFLMDVISMKWMEDIWGYAISCIANIEATSGAIPVLQYAGGQAGNVYRINTTDSDVALSIPASITMEINGKGKRLTMREESMRCKTQSAGNITRTYAIDSNTTFGNSATMPMTANTANDTYRRYREPVNGNPTADHFSWKWSHNTAGEACYILDIGFRVDEVENNR